jgi:monoamine oxidase
MRTSVVVIGAGVAGLTAAHDLAAEGIDVIVVEARSRLGGRIRSVPVGGVEVDIGGAWIHGAGNNPVLGFADTHGLAYRADGVWGLGTGVFVGDEWQPGPVATSVIAAIHDFDPAEALSALELGDASLEDGIEWYLGSRRLHPSVAPAVAETLSRCIGGLNLGAHPSRVSMRGMAAYVEQGGNAVLAGGYSVLVKALASDIDIRLDHEVQTVRHDDGGAMVSTDGREIQAEVVIVTVPLGLLQSGRIDFDPPLPLSHVQALSRLAMATVEKVVLRFEERFWPRQLRSLIHLSSHGGFPYWHDMTDHAGAPTLVGFHNPALVDGDLPEGRIDLALESLHEVFETIPRPIGSYATDWAGDPFSGGSYSYIPIGAAADDLRTLGKAASPGVLFAGEHTVPEYFGTVHAAFVSGRRAAAEAVAICRSGLLPRPQ